MPNAALRFKPADAAGPKPENGAAKPSTAGAGPGVGADGGTPKAGAGKGKKRDGQSGTVYVLADGEIRPVAVQLGITDNRNTEVVGGDLKEGDRIFTVLRGVDPTQPDLAWIGRKVRIEFEMQEGDVPRITGMQRLAPEAQR